MDLVSSSTNYLAIVEELCSLQQTTYTQDKMENYMLKLRDSVCSVFICFVSYPPPPPKKKKKKLFIKQ